MPGSPRKRARKLGLHVPNAGGRPPKHPRTVAPVADAELTALARAALAEVLGATGKRANAHAKVAAAKAWLEAMRLAGSPSIGELETLTIEELEQRYTAAQAVLRGRVQ
ncbi:MAG TPA: hypothetical protein VE987_15655 [Polyangiaceae bacterium]|nr:hypothetical protein [Polyangiaceae bacterium]